MKTTFIKSALKKLVFTGVFTAGISFFAMAQTTTITTDDDDESVITIGPRAGVVNSWMSGLENLNPKINFSGGAFILYSKWEYFGLSADILYTAKGANYDTHVSGEPQLTNRKILLDYLEIPIMANFFFHDRASTFRPKIAIGPSFNYLMGYKNEGQIPPRVSFIEPELAAVGCIGFNWKLREKLWLNVDARYSHGFRNITHLTRLTPDPLRNRYVGLLVGLGFGI